MSEIWSDERIAYVKMALRNNQDALEMFEEMARDATGHTPEESEPGEKPPDHAMRTLLPCDCVILTEETIPELHTDYVTVIRLDNCDFDKALPLYRCLKSYFETNFMYNLRILSLKNATGFSHIVKRIFGGDTDLVSLIEIRASKSDIIEDDITWIINHFRKYTYFIRDIRQISGRYDITAAFLHIKAGSSKYWKDTTVKLERSAHLHYRSGEGEARGPLIIQY